MSFRPVASHPRLGSRGLVPAVFVVGMLAACSGQAAQTPSASTAAGLSAASSGVCAALAAMPDVSAAAQAFTNLAHAQLHALAADQRLERSTAGRVLEAMQRVESDIGQSSAADTLSADLVQLHDSANTALGALDLPVPACDR